MNLDFVVKERRLDIIDAVKSAGKGHIGGALSCIDILVALYYSGFLNVDPQNCEEESRDRFILSKGHSGVALYVILADMGFFPKSWLDLVNQESHLGEHPDMNIPGVETVSGSLGNGLGVAAGMSWVANMKKSRQKVVVLLGDGECYEGSTWEAALFAGHHKLNRLLAIVDRNKMIATAETESVNRLEPLHDKWTSFGWDVRSADGHCMDEILVQLDYFSSRSSEKPMLFIAHTIKGKGLSVENTVDAHHGGISQEAYDKVKEDYDGHA